MKALLPIYLDIPDALTAQELDEAVCDAQLVLASQGIISQLGKLQWQTKEARQLDSEPSINVRAAPPRSSKPS
jgi:hypothetical protein